MISDKYKEAAQIAVVLPAYNEELTVSETIRAFNRELPGAAIYVINNNSKDGTQIVAEQTLSELGCSGAVICERRQGKGNALRRAFLEIDADIYVLADADSTYPAERVRDLITPVMNGQADMVVGDRHSGGHYAQENDRPLHGFGNALVQALVNRLFGANLVDIMSGYRVFSRMFVKSYPILVEGFQIETDMTLHALHQRHRIIEIPVEYKDRPEGSVSKLQTIPDGARVMFAIAQILRYYRPLLFFGTMGFLFSLASVIIAIPVFNDWLKYHYIYHVPLAILASAISVAAMMIFGVGLILDTVVHQQRMEFERDLLKFTHMTRRHSQQ
ncbi:glycosyltransferase involved in cell wall biosynthesis [Paraburkholderia sp. GAS448]|uniref:glycosyltransferase family 2 protein n=1 Tax=Paraburkholderia sp. GAS448 TaxID=3035136 RepID=UPI003D24D4CD